jgi:UDP-N-acetylglucosamine--N-acetylmuramyl-(pentapeptide) pyrophosphoryl-undecaprenol N-acetylglucosamine transferase
MSTLLIAGGGTGGHIYPAIAIACEYVERDASRKVVFVGTERGLEKQIVPKAGFPLELINVAALKGKSGLDLVRNIARLPVGFVQAWRVLVRCHPDVVLGVGGYSSGPVLVAAKLRGVPTIIHEANAFPGLANRILGRFTTAVAVAYPESIPRLKREDGVVTGNPIRAEFFQSGDSRQRPATSNQQRLLVFGGSQGSHVLNEAMTGALLFLAPLKGTLDIVHQTGPNELDKVQAAYRQSAFATARVVPYLEPMANELAAANLVVSRAGAMTLGELAAVGRAAILVPFAAATNNHQEVNARVAEKAGGSIVLTEKELTPERLAGVIREFIGNPARTASMGKAAKRLATPAAAKNIVDLIERIQRN